MANNSDLSRIKHIVITDNRARCGTYKPQPLPIHLLHLCQK